MWRREEVSEDMMEVSSYRNQDQRDPPGGAASGSSADLTN